MQGSSGPRDVPLMCDGVILPYSKSSEARVAAIACGVKLPSAGPKRTEGDGPGRVVELLGVVYGPVAMVAPVPLPTCHSLSILKASPAVKEK